MALISKKKIIYPISDDLRTFLQKYGREVDFPIHYNDLLRYSGSIPLYDYKGNDTLWETVFYAQSDREEIHYNVKKIYSLLKAEGDMSVMKHLYVDRIDLCVYGNTQPFRVRIVNRINDNFDYFYVKNADASRVYGLELEHLLSPNRISYLVHRNTLIEEHIAGIPGEQFMRQQINDPLLNPIRLAKEFVKFNERCFVRLLGDMHSSNFVVDVTPDFEETHYRIRAIDFDQQSYEGKKSIYLPQYFKQNNALIQMGIKHITPESMAQYQKEERALIATRLKTSTIEIEDLLKTMENDTISTKENIESLKKDLAKHYKNEKYLECTNMGQILRESLDQVVKR
jgi:HEPN domain-containing protein